MEVHVDTNSAVPPFRQIIEQVYDLLAAGRLGAGERLPSVRELAVGALVNPNTVSKAYRELTHLGLVKARPGSGVFVTDEAAERARAERRCSTLDALVRAVDAALHCGHEPGTLRDALERHLESKLVPVAPGEEA